MSAGPFSALLVAHSRLQERIQHSRDFLAEAQEGVAGLKCGTHRELSIFAAGSLGRFETGRRSDLDVFLIAKRALSRLEQIEIFSDLIRLNESLKLPPFSGDGRFLKVHEIADLVSATGDSARDDSENLFTTRLLLFLESQPLSNEPLYRSALAEILEHYFRDGKGRKDFQPLFLLNDILRYWRTLCLNYERERTLAKPWWKKNLNLKFSRKLTVFSTVLAIVAGQVRSVDTFLQLSELVPLERLAHALDHIGDSSLQPPFQQFLDDYEQFLAAKSYAELETKDPGALEAFRDKAEDFGELLLSALHSPRLDRNLVRYVLI